MGGRKWGPWWLLWLGCFFFHSVSSAQVLITPRRSGQTQVRTFPQKWQQALLQPSCQGIEAACAQVVVDAQWKSERAISSGKDKQQAPTLPVPSPPLIAEQRLQKVSSGMMLYYEATSQQVAEQLAGQIEQIYLELVQWFQFVPRLVFPYVLYSSYQAFLQTTLSGVQEGVLGITSTVDLSVVLPYFGDDRMFRHVSKHELVHQFTLQYVRHRAAMLELERDPVELLPLWFVEGLAEYIAYQGMDGESRSLVRDLLIYPQAGWPLPTFYGEGVPAYSSIYKFGQVRCAFVAEKFGPEALRRILDEISSPQAGRIRQSGEILLDWTTPGSRFQEAVERVTGLAVGPLERQFATWLRHWAYQDYLQAEELPQWPELSLDESMWLDGVQAAPGGQTLLVRAHEPQSGQLALYLLDVAHSKTPQLVITDGRPGIESLHPLQQHSMALGQTLLVYAAEAVGQDRLYLHTYQRKAQAGAHWSLSPGVSIDVGVAGIVGIVALALAPDEQSLAMIGLSRQGQRNIYWVHWPQGLTHAQVEIVPITQESSSKRAISLSHNQLWWTSDRGTPGTFHLFSSPLPSSANQNMIPQWLGTPQGMVEALYAPSDDRLYWLGIGKDGSTNLYGWSNRQVVQYTHLATSLKQLTAGPNGHLWSLMFRQGRFWLTQVPLAPPEHCATAAVDQGWKEQAGQLALQTHPTVLQHGCPSFDAAVLSQTCCTSEQALEQKNPLIQGEGEALAQINVHAIPQAKRQAEAQDIIEHDVSPPGGQGSIHTEQAHPPSQSPLSPQIHPAGDALQEASATKPSEEQDESGVVQRHPTQLLQHASPYSLWRWDTWRGGALQGFLGGSSAGLFGQLYASVHDLLGQHRFVLNMYALGSLQLTDMHLLYINQTGRLTWILGPFQRLQFRYDRRILPQANLYAYERFYGGLFSVRYPLHRFHYVQLDYQAGAVEYVLDEMTKRWLQDGGRNGLGMDLLPQWQRMNKGIWLQHGITLLWGQDTVRYHPYTGPIAGYAWLLEWTGMQQPQRRLPEQFYGVTRLDYAWYIPLLDAANLMVRCAGGTSFGGPFARQFFLSSFDTLRGVPFGDTRFLLGRHYVYGTLEAQLPLSMLIRVAFLNHVEAIAALDAGGVGNTPQLLLDRRVAAGILGINLGFGPLVLRIHMAKPIPVGVALPVAADRWVPNINLGFVYE